MSWKYRGPIKIYDTNATTGAEDIVGFVKVSSTSTVRPDPAASDLRMYGVTGNAVESGLDATYTAATYGPGDFLSNADIEEPSACEPTAAPGAYICWMGSAPAQAVFRLWSFSDTGDWPLHQTCVPSLVSDYITVLGVPVPLNTLSLAYDAAGGVTVAASSLDDVGVVYKDPSVVQLPTGRWLMLLNRFRIQNGSTTGNWTSMCTPAASLSDVVAFTADDSTFSSTSNVEGPFWVISDVYAVPGIAFRMWVGVPTGVVVTDSSGAVWVYVYFMTNTTSTTGIFPLDTGTYPGSGYTPDIAVKRVPVGEFDYGSGTLVDQADWEKDVDFVPRMVKGDLLGQVRVWLPVNSTPNQVVPFTDSFPHPIRADPAVVSSLDPTSGAEVVSLYFSAISAVGSHVYPNGGFGIWRASALGEGETLDYAGIAYPVDLGVDFIANASPAGYGTAGLPSRDQLVINDTGLNFIDPDPVQLRSGTWQVYCGRRTSRPPALGYLTRFDGAASVVREWIDAWS